MWEVAGDGIVETEADESDGKTATLSLTQLNFYFVLLATLAILGEDVYS